MKAPSLILLACLTLHQIAHGEPDALTNSQAFLAATLAALSTPKMKEAPIKVDAAIRRATGVQENSGAKAIVAIPDDGIAKLRLTELAAGNLPLCRLWLKGYALKLPASTKANIEKKDVDAEGETHSVNIWLIGVRKSAQGKPELIVCANQKEPVMTLPLAALKTPSADDPDAPVQVSVEATDGRSKLVLTLCGTHQVKIALK